MAYEEYRSEYNNHIIFHIYDDVVDYLNEKFMKLIKKVPHSYEYILSHENIYQLLDPLISYTALRPTYLDINKKFMRRFVKNLDVSYVLKNKDSSMPPVAYASVSCRIREEALRDYISACL